MGVPFSSSAKSAVTRRKVALIESKVVGTDLQPFDDAGRERHHRVSGRNESHQGRPFAAPGFQAGQADGADSEGMKVGDQELAVAQVDPRRLDRPGHQFSLVLEVVAVVGGETRAVGENEGSLAASARPA